MKALTAFRTVSKRVKAVGFSRTSTGDEMISGK